MWHTQPWPDRPIDTMPMAARPRHADVDVGEDDVGALAAELQRHALDALGRGGQMRVPTARLPVNVILSTPRVGDQRLAGRVGPAPVTRLSTPGGNTGLLDQLGEADRRERGVLARLQHDRAARGQRRRHLLGERA